VKPVIDPTLLAELEGRKPVTDPAILAQLEGNAAPQEKQSFLDQVGSYLKRETSPEALKRGAGLAARTVTEGITSVATLPLDFGYAVGNLLQGRDDELPGQRFRRELPLPKHEGALEKGVDFISQVAIASKLPNPFAPKATPSAKLPAPTTKQLQDTAENAYETARNAGVVVKPQSFGNVVTGIKKTVADAGIDATLHPKATSALKRLEDAAASGAPQKLEEIEILRRVAKEASGSIDASERRMARLMVDKIDDYLEGLDVPDVVAGDAKTASKALTRAREVYTRLSKSRTIDRLMQRAEDRASQFSGSGLENAIRVEFRQLAMSDKKMRVFTQAEQEAIRKVATGGGFTGNILRTLGKLAPTGVVSAGIGGAAGFAAGGPVGAAGVMAAGGLGRLGATGLAKSNVNAASELMRRGPGSLPQQKLPPDPFNTLALMGVFGGQQEEARGLFD